MGTLDYEHVVLSGSMEIIYIFFKMKQHIAFSKIQIWMICQPHPYERHVPHKTFYVYAYKR